MDAIIRYGGFIDMHPALGMTILGIQRTWTASEEMLPEPENDRVELNVVAAAALPKSSSLPITWASHSVWAQRG
jgi:hypothetical protein